MNRMFFTLDEHGIVKNVICLLEHDLDDLISGYYSVQIPKEGIEDLYLKYGKIYGENCTFDDNDDNNVFLDNWISFDGIDDTDIKEFFDMIDKNKENGWSYSKVKEYKIGGKEVNDLESAESETKFVDLSDILLPKVESKTSNLKYAESMIEESEHRSLIRKNLFKDVAIFGSISIIIFQWLKIESLKEKLVEVETSYEISDIYEDSKLPVLDGVVFDLDNEDIFPTISSTPTPTPEPTPEIAPEPTWEPIMEESIYDKFDYVIAFKNDDRTDTENYRGAMEHYDIISRYANTRGIDPKLLVAVIAQESGGIHNPNPYSNDYGICQINIAFWGGNVVTSYNFDTGEWDSARIVTNEIDYLYGDDIPKLNISNLEDNIDLGARILQNCIVNYNDIHPALRFGLYNWGIPDGIIRDTMINNIGLSWEEVVNSNDLPWMKYCDSVGNGDKEYVQHVLSYVPKDGTKNYVELNLGEYTVFNFKMPDGETISAVYTNKSIEKKNIPIHRS